MLPSIDYQPYLKDIGGLFPRPRIMAQLAAKLRGEVATIDEIAELLVTDTTMVANIVQMANSSYFNFSEPAGSLEEALQRVGFGAIGRMVSVSVANQVYRRELVHYRTPPLVFWESSLAAALFMEALATAGRRDPAEAYLAGLMREIGMLVIDHLLTAHESRAAWDGYQPFIDWERSVCGHDHAETGAELLALWSFPQPICAAVGMQWKPQSAETTPLALSLHLTNQILARCGCDFSVPIQDWAPFAALAARCGVTPEQLLPCLESANATFLRLRSLAS